MAARSRSILAVALACTALLAVLQQAAQSLGFVAPHQAALTASRREASALRGRAALAARGGADAEEDDEDIDYYSVDVETLKPGQELEGVVTKLVRFGAFVDIGADNGVEGLVPTSKLQDGRTEKPEDVVQVGDTVKVWVVETKGDNKVTLSMSQKKIFAPQKQVKADVSLFAPFAGTEELVEGTVANLMNFGAFVQMPAPNGAKGTAQGLVHVTELQEGFTRNVGDVVSMGQKVKVKVLSVDTEKGQIQLSMKGVPNPKNDVTPFAELSDEELVTGKVKSIVNYGAFVDVAPPSGGETVQGLLHISQIQEAFLEDPAEVLEVGMDVKVRVIEVDTVQGKLGLSMKEKKVVEPVAEPVAA